MSLAVAGGALSIDFGRMTVLRTQMQNRADAAAMAGAVHLDGLPDAQARARDVAMNAASDTTGVTSDGDRLDLLRVNFYSAVVPALVAAAGDADSAFIEVILQPKTVTFILQPIMEMLSKQDEAGSQTLNARAMAGPKPFVCAVPPLMMCDPAEADPALDPKLEANIGNMYVLKEPQAGGGPWAPGNFGLLSLPDGSSGAPDIEAALAAITPDDCYRLDVITATGSKTNSVKDGINVRFELVAGATDPAPNLIVYPRDTIIENDPTIDFGDGVWDIAGYWGDKHPAMGGGVLPADLAGASRYQVYLYELGLEFARNGKLTLYPLPAVVPADYTVVTPAAQTLPQAADPAQEKNPHFDGVPDQAPASNGYARRLMQVAILECVADNINGMGTYPTDGNFVEMFITEPVPEPPNAAIYSELVRRLTPLNSPQYYANVRLID